MDEQIISDDLHHQQELLKTHKTMLKTLEHQAALYGPAHTPPYVSNLIEITKKEIQETLDKISMLKIKLGITETDPESFDTLINKLINDINSLHNIIYTIKEFPTKEEFYKANEAIAKIIHQDINKNLSEIHNSIKTLQDTLESLTTTKPHVINKSNISQIKIISEITIDIFTSFFINEQAMEEEIAQLGNKKFSLGKTKTEQISADILSISRDLTIILSSLGKFRGSISPSKPTSIKMASKIINPFCWNNSGDLLVTSFDGSIIFYNINGVKIHTIDKHQIVDKYKYAAPSLIEWNKDGTRLMILLTNGKLQFWGIK